jgi:toxin-antitoxin system PIN domain toxin
MTRYSKSFLFPDLNVWIALTYRKHAHYDRAHQWFTALPEDAQLCFCRLTQVGFLRLLTTRAVMGDEVLGQAAAWNLYDKWLEEGGALYMEEPPSIESAFRPFTQSRNAAAKDWADSYLAAFATAAGLRFVTFDQAFQGKVKQLLVLKP